jgi:hypothetical protein
MVLRLFQPQEAVEICEEAVELVAEQEDQCEVIEAEEEAIHTKAGEVEEDHEVEAAEALIGNLLTVKGAP